MESLGTRPRSQGYDWGDFDSGFGKILNGRFNQDSDMILTASLSIFFVLWYHNYTLNDPQLKFQNWLRPPNFELFPNQMNSCLHSLPKSKFSENSWELFKFVFFGAVGRTRVKIRPLLAWEPSRWFFNICESVGLSLRKINRSSPCSVIP